MVMGDLVLFQDEVNPLMSALFDNGIKVTALHNHFFFDEPKVYFMHIEGEGATEAMANGVKKALATAKEIRAANAQPAKMPCGCEATKEMGVNTWAAFAGRDDNAVVDGDFAMLEDELQGVLKSLRRSGVNIVAIHHHRSGEEPRILFLHYWGRGATSDLAQAVKDALAPQKK